MRHPSLLFTYNILNAGGLYVQNSAMISDDDTCVMSADSASPSKPVDPFKGIVGDSAQMQKIFRLVERVAD